MSEKELEEIYSKIKEEETPDLWDKIERRLEEKPQKKKYSKWIISCSSLAASVVIFLLIAPFISTLNHKQNNAEKKNVSDIEKFVSDKDSTSEDIKEEDENSVDKEIVSIDNNVKNGEEESVDTNGNFVMKESAKTETDSNLRKINAKVEKEGIVLKEVVMDKIEELEMIEAKKLPDELQVVVEELKKIEETQIYYIDLNYDYYTKIGDKVYKILK
ncbi:MAG: hypothetical protein HFJ09_05345 [Lachnospiraceae bacterium]|nr:hypothetical protein [Lachnospiraceae bacterium]